jgi:predicted permease
MGAVVVVTEKLIMVFLLLLIGYMARKTKVVNDSFVDQLSKFLVCVIIPCFQISALQVDFAPELLRGGITVFISCMVMHGVSMVVGFILAKIFRFGRERMAVWLFSCMFANIGFMGIPVIVAVFGEDTVFYCSFASFAFNILTYTLGVAIFCFYSDKPEFKLSWKRVFLTPVNISIAFGLVLFLLDIRLPEFIRGTTQMVGDMVAPLAMIYIGAVLSRTSMKDAFRDKWAYAISVVRLVMMPLLGYFLLERFITDRLILGVVVMGLATPIGVLCAVLAAEYGGDMEMTARYTLVTTLLSAFTLPAFALLFL